jgi:hypothetical protein
MRACILTSPRERWKGGELVKLTHTKAINVSCDILGALCPLPYSEKIKSDIGLMKAHRELISYIAPSRGEEDMDLLSESDLISLCTVFAEIAQLQSEILEASLQKKAPAGLKVTLKDEYLVQACTIKIDGLEYTDQEDGYRLGYLRRKHPLMSNVCQIISEGHSEDFFGSWTAREDVCDKEEHSFNPDKDWRIIFDIP